MNFDTHQFVHLLLPLSLLALTYVNAYAYAATRRLAPWAVLFVLLLSALGALLVGR